MATECGGAPAMPVPPSPPPFVTNCGAPPALCANGGTSAYPPCASKFAPLTSEGVSVGADAGAAWPDTTSPTSMYLVECIHTDYTACGTSVSVHVRSPALTAYQRCQRRPLLRNSGSKCSSKWMRVVHNTRKSLEKTQERRDEKQANAGSRTARFREANVYEYVVKHCHKVAWGTCRNFTQQKARYSYEQWMEVHSRSFHTKLDWWFGRLSSSVQQ
jgi:hypothetical protein